MLRFVVATAVFATVFTYFKEKELVVVDDSIMLACAFLVLVGALAVFGMRRNV